MGGLRNVECHTHAANYKVEDSKEDVPRLGEMVAACPRFVMLLEAPRAVRLVVQVDLNALGLLAQEHVLDEAARLNVDVSELDLSRALA